jgi:hypothetical protein
VIYKIHPLPAEPVKMDNLQHCATGVSLSRATNLHKFFSLRTLLSKNSFNAV